MGSRSTPLHRPTGSAETSADHRRGLRRYGPLLLSLTSAIVLAGCGGGDASDGDSVRTVTETVSDVVPTDQGRATSAAHCDGAIGDVAVDEVQVPSGATCTLEHTTVDGNVSIGGNGTLIARGVAVGGDVESEGARMVEVSASSVIGGNLQVEQGGSAAVSDSQIHGDLEWEEQNGPLSVQRSSVDGNLQADQNTCGLMISNVRVGGDLTCEENNPAPTGGENAVTGNRQDQCASL